MRGLPCPHPSNVSSLVEPHTIHTPDGTHDRNIQYPKNADGEVAEVPIPEQWQHALQGEWPSLKLRNEVSSLYH